MTRSNRPLTRRTFLTRTAAVGCSAAASPLLTPIQVIAAPWEPRLVVIIQRGAMDALDVIQPYGAPEFAGLRPNLGGGPGSGAHDLDGFFSLHPALGDLMPLWQRQELGFVDAVATPYRDKRSHFDGQDLLEAGTATLSGARDGWLNRALQRMPGVEARTAFAIGHGDLKVLNGAAPVADWSPDSDVGISPQAEQLARLVMRKDPLFSSALDEALMLSASGDLTPQGDSNDMDAANRGGSGSGKSAPGQSHVTVAEFAAQQLRHDARIVAFSINGWDTHRRQSHVLKRPLKQLSDTILTLRESLGPDVWGKTAVVAMTEFGRTVRENGTQGTDHGTGGAMILAGGALRGGRVHGTWPGLAEADLYQRRDLMPTADVRAQAAWILRDLIGLDRAALETEVFPGITMDTTPRLVR